MTLLRALADVSNLPTPVIVVKIGDEGVLVWDKASGTLHEVRVASGKVVDETGAGDAFCRRLCCSIITGI